MSKRFEVLWERGPGANGPCPLSQTLSPNPLRGLGGEFEGRAGDSTSPGPPLKILTLLPPLPAAPGGRLRQADDALCPRPGLAGAGAGLSVDPGRQRPGVELAAAPGKSPGPASDPGPGLPGLPGRHEGGVAGGLGVLGFSSSMPTSTWPTPSGGRSRAKPCCSGTGSWCRTTAITTGWRPMTRMATWAAGPRP